MYPPPPRTPPLLPFQCLRLTAKILLRPLRCQEDLRFKISGPSSAGAIGGPWEEGGWEEGGSQPNPPTPPQTPPPPLPPFVIHPWPAVMGCAHSPGRRHAPSTTQATTQTEHGPARRPGQKHDH